MASTFILQDGSLCACSLAACLCFGRQFAAAMTVADCPLCLPARRPGHPVESCHLRQACHTLVPAAGLAVPPQHAVTHACSPANTAAHRCTTTADRPWLPPGLTSLRPGSHLGACKSRASVEAEARGPEGGPGPTLAPGGRPAGSPAWPLWRGAERTSLVMSDLRARTEEAITRSRTVSHPSALHGEHGIQAPSSGLCNACSARRWL